MEVAHSKMVPIVEIHDKQLLLLLLLLLLYYYYYSYKSKRSLVRFPAIPQKSLWK